MLKNFKANRLSNQKQNRHTGFTIVELLIVIVVIGILAAISIVAYNGIQSRARTTSVYADLTNIRKKLEIYNVDHGQYPQSTTDLEDADLSIGNSSNYEIRAGYGNVYYCLDLAENEFGVGVRIAGVDPVSHFITSSSSAKPRSNTPIYTALLCGELGLPGSSPADGAYSTWGLDADGDSTGWLKTNN